MLAMAAGPKLGEDYIAWRKTILLGMAAGPKLGEDYSARYGCRSEAWRRL